MFPGKVSMAMGIPASSIKSPIWTIGSFRSSLLTPIFTLAFFYEIPIFIESIFIGLPDLEIEVCDIIIDDLRGTVRLFYQIGIDPADDFIFVIRNEVQGVVNIVRIEIL